MAKQRRHEGRTRAKNTSEESGIRDPGQDRLRLGVRLGDRRRQELPRSLTRERGALVRAGGLARTDYFRVWKDKQDMHVLIVAIVLLLYLVV